MIEYMDSHQNLNRTYLYIYLSSHRTNILLLT